MKAKSRALSVFARLARSVLGAMLLTAAAALVDSAWAEDPSLKGRLSSLYVADLGLLAPVAVVVGLAAAAFGFVVDPDAPPSMASLFESMRDRAATRRASLAAFAPLALVGAFFWMTISAHLARALLAIEVAPSLSGVAIATASFATGVFVSLAVLATTPPLRHVLANASESQPSAVDPVVTAAGALFLVAGLFAIGVATGSVSGEGGFLGIYGIFKRPELDLRGVGVVAAIAIGGFFGPSLASKRSATLALVLSVAPLMLTARDATSLDQQPLVAQSLERGAPAGKLALAWLRKATDRDHDGYSALFAGGDCNDHDPHINPGAQEIPDNGIDEDCSGADLSLSALPPPKATPTVQPTSAPKPKLAPDLNLVLITIDTLRADVGFDGYSRAVSPNLDKLALSSTVFEHAYSLASYTGKSVGPLLIGKYPSETHRNWGHFNKFEPPDVFVAERLKAAGIRTLSVQAHRYFGKFGGLDRGFDVVDMSTAPPEGTPWDVDNTATSARLSDAALKVIADPANTSGRFFLWIHYLDPHADYLHHDDVPDFGRDQRDLYDGEIAFTDKHVGRVLDAIAAAPWGAKTAVVVTSDHGEAFGEHKMYRHGFELWEELVHVPLLVHVPGAAPSRVAVRRSAIDVVPTILETMGVAPPKGPRDTSSDFIAGVSLLPDMFLAAGSKPDVRDILIDMPAGPYNDARRSFIHGDLKLTTGGAHPELFDLAKDPGETNNLWKTDPSAKATIEPAWAEAKAQLAEVKVTGDRK